MSEKIIPKLIPELKQEIKYLVCLFILALALFKLLFHQETFTNLLKITLSLFWLFILPGFSLMYYWHPKFNFLERFFIGTALGTGLIGISSYYLALAGLNFKYQIFILPLIVLLIAGLIIWKKK